MSSETIFPGPGLARQSCVSRLAATPTASGLSFQVPPLQRTVRAGGGARNRLSDRPSLPPRAERQRPRQAHTALPLTPPGKVREPATAQRTPRLRAEAGMHTQRAQGPEERLRLERRSPWAQATGRPREVSRLVGEVAPCSWGQIVVFLARIDARNRRTTPRDIFHSLPLGFRQNLPPPLPLHFGMTSEKR